MNVISEWNDLKAEIARIWIVTLGRGLDVASWLLGITCSLLDEIERV